MKPKKSIFETPDASEAMEFLCLAERGEVTHYKVLCQDKKASQRKFSAEVKAILEEKNIFKFILDWLNR